MAWEYPPSFSTEGRSGGRRCGGLQGRLPGLGSEAFCGAHRGLGLRGSLPGFNSEVEQIIAILREEGSPAFRGAEHRNNPRFSRGSLTWVWWRRYPLLRRLLDEFHTFSTCSRSSLENLAPQCSCVQLTEAFGIISYVFQVKVNRRAARTWKSEHYFNELWRRSGGGRIVFYSETAVFFGLRPFGRSAPVEPD